MILKILIIETSDEVSQAIESAFPGAESIFSLDRIEPATFHDGDLDSTDVVICGYTGHDEVVERDLLDQLFAMEVRPTIILIAEEIELDEALRLMRKGVRDIILLRDLARLPDAAKREGRELDLRERLDSFKTAVRQAEVRLLWTFMQSPVGLAEISISGRYLRVNARYLELMHLRELETTGRHWIRNPQRPLAHGWPGTFDESSDVALSEWIRFESEEGPRILQRRLMPVRDEAGEVIFYTDSIQDVTELVLKAEASGGERDLLRTILDSFSIGICALDTRGVPSWMNEAARTALELTAPPSVSFHELVHGKTCSAQCELLVALHTCSSSNASAVFRTAAGKEVEMCYSLSPIRSDGPFGCVIIFTPESFTRNTSPANGSVGSAASDRG